MSNLNNTSIFFLAVMSQDLSLAVASHYIYHKSDTNAYTHTHPRLPVQVDACDEVRGGEGQRRGGGRQSMQING